MKNPRANVIDVVKRINIGVIPVFIQLAHRSLEKNQPTASDGAFTVAKDILKVSITDHRLLDMIDSVELQYKKGA